MAEASLYLCTDARTAQGDLAEFLDAAFRGGADIIQLRDKSIEARAEIAALEVLKDAAARHGKLFSVNDRADVALLTDADVFHVGQGDLTSGQARAVLGPDVLLGRSTHSLEQALAAEATKPWFAIGGIAAGERLDAVRKAGANRAVVVRAITSAEDPAAAARELKEELE